MKEIKICRYCNQEQSNSHHCSGKVAFAYGEKQGVKQVREFIDIFVKGNLYHSGSCDCEICLNQKIILNKFKAQLGK